MPNRDPRDEEIPFATITRETDALPKRRNSCRNWKVLRDVVVISIHVSIAAGGSEVKTWLLSVVAQSQLLKSSVGLL